MGLFVEKSMIEKAIRGSYEERSSIIEQYVRDNFELFGAPSEDNVALISTKDETCFVASSDGSVFECSYRISDGSVDYFEVDDVYKSVQIDSDENEVSVIESLESLAPLGLYEAMDVLEDVDLVDLLSDARHELDEIVETSNASDCIFDSHPDCIRASAVSLAECAGMAGDNESALTGVSISLLKFAVDSDRIPVEAVAKVHGKWCRARLA